MKELNDKFIEVFDEMYWSIDHDYKCGIEWTLKKFGLWEKFCEVNKGKNIDENLE